MKTVSWLVVGALCLAFGPGYVQGDRPAPAVPPPAEKSGYEFKFVERPVYYRMPDYTKVKGKIDKEGTFIPAAPSEQPPRPRHISEGVSGYPRENSVAINDRRRHHKDDATSLDDAPRVEFVYEYRSGYLIAGELTEGGYFVPRPGLKVIPFADYVYSPQNQRIYNLPGEFVWVGK